jgi:hypothetical protein
MNDPDRLLERAKKSLLAAERLLADGDPEFAASRVYYSYSTPHRPSSPREGSIPPGMGR